MTSDNMKKIFGILGILAMSVSLSACGSDTIDSPKKDMETEMDMTVKMDMEMDMEADIPEEVDMEPVTSSFYATLPELLDSEFEVAAPAAVIAVDFDAKRFSIVNNIVSDGFSDFVDLNCSGELLATVRSPGPVAVRLEKYDDNSTDEGLLFQTTLDQGTSFSRVAVATCNGQTLVSLPKIEDFTLNTVVSPAAIVDHASGQQVVTSTDAAFVDIECTEDAVFATQLEQVEVGNNTNFAKRIVQVLPQEELVAELEVADLTFNSDLALVNCNGAVHVTLETASGSRIAKVGADGSLEDVFQTQDTLIQDVTCHEGELYAMVVGQPLSYTIVKVSNGEEYEYFAPASDQAATSSGFITSCTPN